MFAVQIGNKIGIDAQTGYLLSSHVKFGEGNLYNTYAYRQECYVYAPIDKCEALILCCYCDCCCFFFIILIIFFINFFIILFIIFFFILLSCRFYLSPKFALRCSKQKPSNLAMQNRTKNQDQLGQWLAEVMIIVFSLLFHFTHLVNIILTIWSVILGYCCMGIPLHFKHTCSTQRLINLLQSDILQISIIICMRIRQRFTQSRSQSTQLTQTY